MALNYIKVPGAYDKLKKAEELYSPVIMTAGCGWGKSAAVQYFYRRKNPLILYCRDGKLSERPEILSIRANVVIVEDLQWLSEDTDIRYLRELLGTMGRQIVMLTRGTVPGFLAAEDMRYGFVRIGESELALGEKEVALFFRTRGIDLHPEDLATVTEVSKGYAVALHYYAVHMENGQRYSGEIQEAVWQDLYHLWDGWFSGQWSEEFRTFMLSVCPYDDFTIQMAGYLTGNDHIGQLIEYCRDRTSQLGYRTDGRYVLRPEIRRYYLWKRELSWSRETVSENYRKAADYYDSHGDISNALRFYRQAGATGRLKELLIRNARTHPGMGHYIETKEYYLELPEADIRELPVLMAGMSMLCSLILQPEESEDWYRELVSYENEGRHPREKRREARAWLAYLDIALPHRGAGDKLRIIKKVFNVIGKRDVDLPEFSVTGNMPTIMNGSLDFCEWSKNDTQIARLMTKPIEVVTGKHAHGLITISLAESGFEKGTMSDYEVMTRLSEGYEAASQGGRIEMCFVAVGIQVRQHLVEGRLSGARRICELFRDKVNVEKAVQLLPNLEAFEMGLSLYGGTYEGVRSYIRKLPNALVTYSILDRYRQMVKLRCLIAEDLLEEALELSSFLTGYFASYERNFYRMENEVLKSVILYRMGSEHWREHLAGAVRQASGYHFVRLLSLEGAAVLPLLLELQDSDELQDTDGAYLSQIIEECRAVALFYPDYLRFVPREAISLTQREMQVLSMLCAGMSTEEICTELKISYDGLKKRNRSIYRKLGARNRVEAERNAARLGLVHHVSE